MAVPLLNLTRQYIQIKEKIDSAMQNVFEHGQFILGPECYRKMKLRKGDYPVSEKSANSLVSIPVFPDMLKEEQEEVIEIVRSVSA